VGVNLGTGRAAVRMAAVAFGVLLVAADGFAQASDIERAPEGLFRVGPVAFTPALSILDVGVDDNVLGEPMGRRDFTYTVGPQLQAALPVGRVRIVGTGSLGFVYFQKFKEQQSTSGVAKLRANLVTGRVRPFAEVAYSRVRARSDEDVLTRVRSAKPTVSAGLDVQLTPMTALTGWVERSAVAYDDREEFLGVPLAAQLNQRTQVVAGGTRYFLTPLTTVVTAAELRQHRFEGDGLRDADSLRFAPSVEFAPGAFMTGRLSAGFQDFKPLHPALPRLRGLVASANATWTLLGITRFDVRADRDVGFSFDATQPYYWRTGAQLTVSQRLVGPVDLVAIGERRTLSYQAFGEQVLQAQRDRIADVGWGLGVRLSEDARFRVVYDRFDRQSTGSSARTFQRRRVLASLEILPQ
jgi:hypothetical protein